MHVWKIGRGSRYLGVGASGVTDPTHLYTHTHTLRGIPEIFVGIWECDNSSWRAALSRKMKETQKLI